MTQHEKILELCSDGEFHCQNEFRALYIFSPHKRRSELERKHGVYFEHRKCEHGIQGQRDYRMIEPIKKDVPAYAIPLPKVAVEMQKLF